jgi:hypothetical protein
LNIDTSTKFVQMKTVLDRLSELKRERYSNDEISELLTPKFDDTKSSASGQSSTDASRLVVITSYNSASYQIESIIWDETPKSKTFDWKEIDETGKVTKSKVTVAEYLERRWGVKLTADEFKQPLLQLTARGQPVYLVPSRCHEASLPKDFTKDANKMKDLRNYMITDPTIRYNRIGDLTATVFSQAKILNDWNIKVNQNFAQIKGKQLYHCKVLDPKNN